MGKEKIITNRRQRIQRRFSVIMYLCIFAALCYPWIMIGEVRYNLVSFAMCLKTEGAASIIERAGVAPDPSYAVGLAANLYMYLVFFIFCVLYLITMYLRKDWYLNAVALLMAVFFTYAGMWEYMIGTICSNVVEAILFPGVLMALAGIECIGRKMIEIWDREVVDKAEYEKKERRERAERKARLYFPGKYNRLFFQVIWKNFVGNLKEYSVLLLCNGLVFAFVVSGFGMQALVKEGDMSYKTGYPAGAGKVLLRGLVELGIVGLLMLVLLLLYYLRKRLPEYGVFKTLGIRTKTIYSCLGAELGIGTAVSLIFGGVLGVIMVTLFRSSAGGGSADWLSPLLFLKAAAIMLLIYLVTFFATHDLFVGFRMGSSTELQMMKEWIPRHFQFLFAAAGIYLAVTGVLQYRENVNAEDAGLLIQCCAGVYLIIRFGIAGYLHWKRKRKGALSRLLRQHPFYHKSRSAAWYIFGLCVLQTCIIGLFFVQLFSARLVTDTDKLFPYDLVLLAGEGEEEDAFLKEIQKKEGVSAEVYPMFRVSGCDVGMAGIASQNIGISETAYHALKKARDPKYQVKPLGLDDKGERIYIVHQQDMGTEAQPIDYYDYYVPRETPVLYTGPVCELFSPGPEFAHGMSMTSYYIRQIAGEETDSLIGVFSQGERENLVVFSDAYFEKAKDQWKVTHPYWGDILTEEGFAKEGVEPNQGPARLVLIQAEEQVLKELEPELTAFKERHRTEEKYDTKVRSSYLKTEIKKRADAELRMRKTMALLLSAAFFAASVLLLGIKMMTEKRMNIRRAQFLNCMGMRKAERMALLRSEIRVYYVLTVIISSTLSAGLMLASLNARLYTAADAEKFLRMAVPAAVCELVLFGVAAWILTEWNVRRIEKKVCEV